MGTYYNGNLSNLRKRRIKIIAKRAELKKQLSYNIPMKEQNGINKKILELSTEIDRIETEINKIQKGMQNSNRWMDGTLQI